MKGVLLLRHRVSALHIIAMTYNYTIMIYQDTIGFICLISFHISWHAVILQRSLYLLLHCSRNACAVVLIALNHNGVIKYLLDRTVCKAKEVKLMSSIHLLVEALVFVSLQECSLFALFIFI